jgi:hypothetical protein
MDIEHAGPPKCVKGKTRGIATMPLNIKAAPHQVSLRLYSMNNTGQVARNNDWVNAAERGSGPRHDLRPSCQAPPMGVP